MTEGKSHYSWIASNWVDFSGETLKIVVTDINQKPKITIREHPTISYKQIQKFNFRDYISAYDYEDGDITDKIELINQVSLSGTGTYKYELEVKDSYGKKDTNTLIVTVVKENVPPVIEAFDQTIYQYDTFEYLKNVIASDEEDGNLTRQLTYSGNVNTEKLGSYPVTYTVKDSNNAITHKTIHIQVIKNPRENIRYVSNHSTRLFYKQAIPKNWTNKIEYLKEQIENPKIISSIKIHIK